MKSAQSSSKGEKLQRVQAFYPFFSFGSISSLLKCIYLETHNFFIRYLSCNNEIPLFFLENGIKELIQGREIITMYMLLSRFFPPLDQYYFYLLSNICLETHDSLN